jgi:hypothetical protein
MKRKILMFSFVIGALVFALSMTPEDVNANQTYPYCYGYEYKKCGSTYVIRCTCTGGSKCYAAWQDLC